MALMVTCCSACSKSPERPDTGGKKEDETKVSERNLERAVILIENAAKHYSKDGTTALSMTYNPFTSKPSDNLVSVWEYTSSIEAVTAAMNSMKAFRDAGNSAVYDSSTKPSSLCWPDSMRDLNIIEVHSNLHHTPELPHGLHMECIVHLLRVRQLSQALKTYMMTRCGLSVN